MSCLIKATGLTKFFGQKQALKQVTFEINKGQPIALVGPNGAGKTTLFSVLCGYIRPSAGEVSVFGHAPGSHHTFGRLSALPQDAQLDPRFSIAHQLSFYGQLQGFDRKKSQAEMQRTLELVGMKEAMNEQPSALSHGMRKRVTIAQALIGSPEIVMLDEATAGLDPLHAREIRAIVASLAEQTTFILSSHDLSELERLCHQVLYLDQGQLREHQTLTNDVTHSYLTLRTEQQIPELVEAIRSIAEVTDVANSQDREYLITVRQGQHGVDDEQLIPVDMQILQLCHQHNWRYRQLINGKTLENQLFN